MVAIPIANISTPAGFPGGRQLNSARQAANTDAPLTFAQTVSHALGKRADTAQPVTLAKNGPVAKTNSPLEPSATVGKTKPSAKDSSNDPKMTIPIGALSLLIALQKLPAAAPQSAKAAPSTQSGAMPVTLNSSGASAAPQSKAASLAELRAIPVSTAISAAFAIPPSTKAITAMQAGAEQVGTDTAAPSVASRNNVSADPAASLAADSANIRQIPQPPLPQIPSGPLPSGPTAGNDPGAEGALPLINNESGNNPVDAKAAQSSSTLQIKDVAARSANQPLGCLIEAALPLLPQPPQPARADAIPGATSNSAAQPVVAPAPAEAATGLGAAANAPIAAPHNEPPLATASSSSSSSSVFHEAALASQHVSVVQASSNSGSAGHQNSQDPSANQNQPNPTDASDNFIPANQPSSHDVQKLVSAMVATSVGNQAPSQPAIPTAAPSVPPAIITPALAPTTLPANQFSSAAPPQDAPAASPHTSGPIWQTDVAPGRMVSSAELLATSGHSEMRVAMDTDRLGSIELRAHMIGDQLGAAITVEKRDVHAALAAELPVLQQSLSDKHLRIDQVALLHGTTSGNTPDAGTPAKQDPPSARRAPVTPWSLNSAPVSSISRAEQKGIFDSYGRLSVHA